jgi:hypothetical protein
LHAVAITTSDFIQEINYLDTHKLSDEVTFEKKTSDISRPSFVDANLCLMPNSHLQINITAEIIITMNSKTTRIRK